MSDKREWKPFDVFRWSYARESDDTSPRDRYWCCSCIAVVSADGKILRDTYWSSGMDGRMWTRERADESLELRYVCNLEGLKQVGTSRRDANWAREHYREEDIVDLSHPNGGTVYLRPGAEVSLDVELATLISKRDSAQRTADLFAQDVERKREEIRKALESQSASG